MSLIDEKWELLFEKYHIREEIRRNGRFLITADQIRQVKEPRLMTNLIRGSPVRRSLAAGSGFSR